MPFSLSGLKSELQADPSGLGYAPLIAGGNHTGCADALNLVRAGISIARDLVQAHEIFEQIVPAEWVSLVATERERINQILSMGWVNVSGANTRAAFQAAFGAGTTTRANLLAYLTRQGSRAEQLFGSGVQISHDQIAQALKS